MKKRIISALLALTLLIGVLPVSMLTASAFDAENYRPEITEISVGAPVTGADGGKYLPVSVYFTANEDIGDQNAVYFLEGYLKGTLAGGKRFEGVAGLGMTLMGPLKPDALEDMDNAFSWEWSDGAGKGVVKYNVPLLSDGATQTVEQSAATGQLEVNGLLPGDKLTLQIETVMNASSIPEDALPDGGSLFSNEATFTIEEDSAYPKTITVGEGDDVAPAPDSADGGDSSGSGSLAWLWILIGALGAAAAGCGIFFAAKKKKATE